MKKIEMKPSHWVTDAIKEAEGLRLGTYTCPAGKLTIGYGHTGSDVQANCTINKEQAEAQLQRDISQFAGQINLLLVWGVTQGQFDALCSFVFNLGIGALKGSTLLRKLESDDVQGAADEFLRWDKAHVKGELVRLPGLTKRRTKERERFLS